MAGEGYSKVPLGRAGTGRAVVLDGSNTFTQLGQQVLRMKEQEAKERKATEADLGKLLSEDIKTQWTEDTIKYFKPKIDSFRKEAIDVYKQNKGRLAPIQLYELSNKWNTLKNEANLNNQMFKEEADRREELRKDLLAKDPVLDQQASAGLRSLYNNPYQSPELAKEIQTTYGGNINAWRAANKDKFENVRTFSPKDFISEKFKDKLSEEYVTDEKGRPVAQRDASGHQYYTKVKGVNPKSIQTEIETVWGGNTYKDDKFKEYYLKQAESLPVTYRQGGVPTIQPDGLPPEKYQLLAETIKKAPQLASMTADQQKTYIAKQLAASDVRATFPAAKSFEFYHEAKGGAGDKTRKDFFTFTPTTKAEAIKTGTYAYPKEASIFTRGLKGLGIPMAEKTVEGADMPYIALNYDKTATDNAPLYLNDGRQVNPLGFQKTKTGWELIGRQIRRVEDKFGNFTTKEEPVTVQFSNKDDVARMAAYIGYDDVKDFENKLEAEAKRVTGAKETKEGFKNVPKGGF